MSMSKKLYNLMDWAEIEAVTYSEEDHPKAVLGAHPVRGGQTLVTAYRPDAAKVAIKFKDEDKATEMELADEEGYFALLVKNREPFEYCFIITDKEGNTKTEHDPYSFPGVINKRDVQKFNSGIHYRAYDMFGADLMRLSGVDGVHFAVWAPNALRVSVVGDFNNWDGRIHQMERLWESGIFELFIPGVKAKDKYKFEIRMKNGICIKKADPYAFEAEDTADGASIVSDLSGFAFTDDEWIEKRGEYQNKKAPVSIFETALDHLGSGITAPKKLAKEISDRATQGGYTHVLINDVLPGGNSLYAPAPNISGENLMTVINELHKKKLGVILSWDCSKFPEYEGGLARFDGTCLYEDGDERRSTCPGSSDKYFNTGRNEVKNFLIANALFWVSVYHADGLKVNDTARMLYLDYGKAAGQWTPNMYGGNENLESLEFFKHLNSVMKKFSSDVLVIADDESTYPDVTKGTDEGGLGFSFKLNTGWCRDVLGYLRYEPLSRSSHYNEVCFPMIYQYNESFIMPLAQSFAMQGRKTLFDMMPGDEDEKFSNLRALMAFFMFHPGKKLIYPGESLKENIDGIYSGYISDLLKLYRSEKPLYELDDEHEGFEWINNISANENILVFARHSSDKKDVLVCLVNFLSIPRKEYKIGVPAEGRYTEIFNSDDEKYGGFGFINAKPIASKKDECDTREDSIRVRVAPMSVALFKLTK
ncbi:MAG: 1,4-alpha-glucan branching enzyme [Lachnospiraceae bacterium]|nr:1,4-alpha-glucan branching enzyme [Lachnospiraceae bacterium]